MFEQKSQSLLPLSKFLVRLAGSISVGLLCIAVALGVGMAGYHFSEHMSWLDAFLNAAMILSGMGQVNPLQTVDGKLFAGFYALFSGLAFIAFISIILAPVVHRFLHKFHVEWEREKAANSKTRR